MDCPFCGTAGNDNRCVKCGMNKDAFIVPVEVKEAVVIPKVTKPTQKKGK